MKNIDRICKIAEKEGITLTSLERQIGASKGVLSRAHNQNTDIQGKWLSKIVENYPQYNSRWLLTGKGEMIIKDYSVINTVNESVSQYSNCKLCNEKENLINELKHTLRRNEEEIDWLRKQLDTDNKPGCDNKSKRNSA